MGTIPGMEPQEMRPPRLCAFNRLGLLVGLPVAAGVLWQYPVDVGNSVATDGWSAPSLGLIAFTGVVMLAPVWMASFIASRGLEFFFRPNGAWAVAAMFIGTLAFVGFAAPFLLNRIVYDFAGVEPVARRWLFDWLVRTLA